MDFVLCNHNKKHLPKVGPLFAFQFQQLVSKAQLWRLPALGVTLQPYEMQRSIGLGIWVIEFVFFCIGVAILPANIVESTVRAMITPHDWQGIEGDSFRGVGVMINGIERKGRQCAAWWNGHHRGQDEREAIGHILVGCTGQSWCVTWKPRKTQQQCTNLLKVVSSFSCKNISFYFVPHCLKRAIKLNTS